MHNLGVVDLKVYLAQKNHGYSIPAQSYDFCPHLIQLDILDFTLSLIHKMWIICLVFFLNPPLTKTLDDMARVVSQLKAPSMGV